MFLLVDFATSSLRKYSKVLIILSELELYHHRDTNMESRRSSISVQCPHSEKRGTYGKTSNENDE